MTSEVRDAAGGSAAREEARQLLSVSAEASLFWRLRYRVVRSLLRTALRESRFQVLSVALAMLLLWAGLLVLFLEGFSFIRSGLVHPGMRAQMTHAVFNIFFLALTVMLFFSAAIVLYGGLYRSEEVVYLLATPARSERIRDAVERAYAEKYRTPANLKYVRGFRTLRRRAATIEFVPR